MSPEFLNHKICPLLYTLSQDKVPNIRFNVSKTIEIVYGRVSYSNKDKCRETLKKMIGSEEDFDAKFFAEKALKSIK